MTTERDKFSEFDEPGFNPSFTQADLDQEQASRMTDEPMVPKSRLDEVIQQRDRAEAGREQVIRSMLHNPGQPASAMAPAQAAALPPGVDKEVADAVDPLLQSRLQQMRQEVRQEVMGDIAGRYGNVLSRVERDMNLSELDDRVPGFKAELYSDVKTMWDEMPPEQRKEYDSKAGMEALALKARLRRIEQSQGRDLSPMAHSAYAQTTNDRSAGPTEDDIWNLSPDEFRRRYPAGG